MTAYGEPEREISGRDDSIQDAAPGPRTPARSHGKGNTLRANDGLRNDDDRRDNPRLRLAYSISVGVRTTEGVEDLDHGTTDNLSARGAYFCTANGSAFHVGQPVALTVSVPHRIATDGREVLLSLRGDGHVVRVEGSTPRRFYGEDGLHRNGVAVEFFHPLRFDADWF